MNEWFVVQFNVDETSSAIIPHVIQDHLQGSDSLSVHRVRNRKDDVDGSAGFLQCQIGHFRSVATLNGHIVGSNRRNGQCHAHTEAFERHRLDHQNGSSVAGCDSIVVDNIAAVFAITELESRAGENKTRSSGNATAPEPVRLKVEELSIRAFQAGPSSTHRNHEELRKGV